MSKSITSWKSGALAALLFVLAGCGGGGSDPAATAPPPPPPTFSIGGTVFSSGGTIVLQNNGGDDLVVGNVGTFRFPIELASGALYAVTVKSSPGMPLQTCVSGSNAGGPAAGTIAGADVTNLFVSCSPVALKLGGNVTGLVGSGLVLASDLQALPIAANGAFQFTAPILSTGSYAVTVQTQPSAPAQTCVVTNASGNQPIADVTNVQVTCSAPSSFACGTENGTVVTHSSDIAASETWAGDGTVHRIPNNIAINAPATVTINKCAIVELADNVGIDVRGATSGTSTATLVSAGNDGTNGFVTFRSSVATGSTHHWRSLRGLNSNSRLDLRFTLISDAAPNATTAAIQMQGGSTLPDPLLKTDVVQIQNLAGPGVHLSNAAFTADSTILYVGGAVGYPIEVPAMALGSIPTGAVLVGNQHDEIFVTENANIFDNLDIRTTLPIRFNTSGVHVGGLAPSFVPNMTLTLEAGVTLKFAKWSTGPTMVTFGDGGQAVDKNAALVVRGTASQPVTLTSDETNPGPGDWAGIWLRTSNGSQIDHLRIAYAGGDAAIGPASCGPITARHAAPLLVGDDTDAQYLPPSVLITNSTFSNNAGSFAIDSVWQGPAFGPVLTATNTFTSAGSVCTQSKNFLKGGCFVGGVDQRGCLVP
ncbi:MAG: hypothetical protein ABI460_10910 [Caldimonas sp.]